MLEDLLLSPQQALQESPHRIDQAVGCDGDDYPCRGRRFLLAECAASRAFAGASAPEVLVKQVVDKLRQLGGVPAVESKGIAEKVEFPLPKGLA